LINPLALTGKAVFELPVYAKKNGSQRLPEKRRIDFIISEA
jgi:hypothetical protein